MRFTYLEKYGGTEVRRSVVLDRRSLKPGKWFYLRAPKIFIEKILPKLTHKLGDFANIKRGFTTGANDFFYMKDISHLYEIDYNINPQKFDEWGVKTETREELERQGLIYIENEGGAKFVINKKDVTPIIRSPKQLGNYFIDRLVTLCLYTNEPGEFTKRYIENGEGQGIQKRPTLKNRNPWFKLPELKPSHVILPKSLMDILYIPYSENKIMCDCRFYTFIGENILDKWLFLNSSIFLIIIELFCRRLGGGASDIMVDDYEQMLVPDLSNLKIDFDYKRLDRPLQIYYKEIHQKDRMDLDIAVLKALGFDSPESLLDNIYSDFIEIVDDRLVKADRPLKRLKK